MESQCLLRKFGKKITQKCKYQHSLRHQWWCWRIGWAESLCMIPGSNRLLRQIPPRTSAWWKNRSHPPQSTKTGNRPSNTAARAFVQWFWFDSKSNSINYVKSLDHIGALDMEVGSAYHQLDLTLYQADDKSLRQFRMFAQSSTALLSSTFWGSTLTS